MRFRFLAAPVVVVLMTSCGTSSVEPVDDRTEDAAPPALTSMEIGLPTTAMTRTGDGAQAWVRTDDQYGQHYDTTVTWSSSDSTTATVGGKGFLTVLSSGSVSITARAGQLEASQDLTIDLSDPADESRVWEAYCLIRDSLESYAPGLSSCVDARLWAWNEDGGKDIVLEVRNLQGSLGGKYDTATRAFLTDIGLIALGESLIQSVSNVDVRTAGAVEKKGAPIWPLTAANDKSFRFSSGLHGVLTGCGRTGLYVPQSEYRNCVTEGVDGHLRFSFHVATAGWPVEAMGLIVNLRFENEAGNTQMFCNGSNGKSCLELSIVDVHPSG
jgi:Bacterial Ig-like domain (group 2)